MFVLTIHYNDIMYPVPMAQLPVRPPSRPSIHPPSRLHARLPTCLDLLIVLWTSYRLLYTVCFEWRITSWSKDYRAVRYGDAGSNQSGVFNRLICQPSITHPPPPPFLQLVCQTFLAAATYFDFHHQQNHQLYRAWKSGDRRIIL